MNRKSINDAKKVIEKLFPKKEIREAYLKMFSEAIAEARRYGDEKWGVTLDKTQVRLNVVHNVACTLEGGRIWFALPEKIGEQDIFPNSLPGWVTDSFKYKNIPSITGYYDYLESYHDKTWPQIREWLFKFIELASNKGKKLHFKSQKSHSPGVLAYMENKNLNDEVVPEAATAVAPPAMTQLLQPLIKDIEILKNDFSHTERDHESLVESFYTLLGYRKASEIKYRIGRIDISIRVNEKILIVNEVKKDWNLSWKDEYARRQAYNYAHETGAQYVVLTNGDYYAIFDLNNGTSYRDNFVGDLRLTEQLTADKFQLIEILMKK